MDERVLLSIRCQLEELVTQREAMIVANKEREAQGHTYAYDEVAFNDLAGSIAALHNQIWTQS